jgi:preprotein translocase subunit SecB
MTNADNEIQEGFTILERFPISVGNIYLVHCHFVDRDRPDSEPSPVILDEVPLSMRFAFVRPNPRKLVMAMICEIETEKPYSLEVMYAGEFTMDDDFPEDAIEDTWKTFSAEVAPIILYPYVREFVSELTNRGRAASLTLPVLFHGFRIDPESIELPPARPYPSKQKRKKPR